MRDKLAKVTRLEVIDSRGRQCTLYGVADVELSFQDDDRTLKIFCTNKDKQNG